MVFDASYVDALNQFSDTFYYAKRQLGWLSVGLLCLLVSRYLPLNFIKTLSRPLFIISISLLLLVMLPPFSREIYGARRWLSLGPISVQPSEIMKLALILYFPTWLKRRQSQFPLVALSIVTLGLVLFEPDMGTAIILTCIISALYYFSGASLIRLFGIGLFVALIGLVLIITSAYRYQRLVTFLNPQTDPLGSSYHINQVILSLGSGGFLGTGIGRSRQKYQYLPEATTDSIFAVVGEETGFVGSLLLIMAFFMIGWHGFNLAGRIQTPYAQLVAAGIIAWYTSQAFLNFLAMVAIVPLTGIPLPFVSYGGSSLVMLLTGLGVYLNCSSYQKPT